MLKKTAKVILSLSLVFLLMGSLAFSAENGKMTLAVMNFKNQSGYSGAWQIGEGMASMLATSLFKSGRFNVVERDQMEAIMQEKKLALQGITDSSEATELGKLIGADYIITGTVSEFGLSKSNTGGIGGGLFRGFGGLDIKTQSARVVVDVRILNVKNGQLVAADQGEGKESTGSLGMSGGDWSGAGAIKFGSEGFDSTLPGKATRKAINNLVEKIIIYLYKAKIIDVTGNEVTINIGTAGGIKKDTKMDVYAEGKEIRDPDTGELLGKKKELIGQIKITDVQDKYSTGIIMKGSGPVAPGYLVEKSSK